jgi:hypothetical protein
VSSRSIRLIVIALATALVALTGAANPTPAAAAGMKVVVIVGPVGSNTASYKDNARRYASQARSYGASVTEIYSPNATWSRVKAAAQGANVLIYLGHGNGSPSPYGAFSKYTKDGFGLNRTAGAGNYNTKYWGEYYVYSQIHLAPNAVVILNRLCYASGNSEWGMANPTKTVAKTRVQNYASGFLRAGARAIFAEGITSASYILYGLFRTTRTIGAIFQSLPRATNAIQRASGDQKGPAAPSVPARRWLSIASNRLSHNCCVPVDAIATNTSPLPSGATASSAVPRGNCVPAVANTEKVTRPGLTIGRFQAAIASAPIRTAAAPSPKIVPSDRP